MNDKTEQPKWEIVAHGLWRIPVPGGWIYSDQTSHMGSTLVFVPDPEHNAIAQALDCVWRAIDDFSDSVKRLEED